MLRIKSTIIFISDQNVSSCQEATKYTFNEGVRWTSEKDASVSVHSLFKKKYTSLTIIVAVRPNTDEIKEDIREYFTKLKEKQDCNDMDLQINARYKFTENYLVTDNTSKVPWILKPSVYWMFAFLGFSVPFRMLLYCKTDNVTYTVQKQVFNSDGTVIQEKTVISHEEQFQDFHNCNKPQFSSRSIVPVLYKTDKIDDFCPEGV